MNKKSSSIRETANNEKGALLLSMVIIIVVFAVLGAVLLSITSTSTFTQVYSNNATKAYYMAESGFRYATMNIVTIGKDRKDCLKCHSSHGKETIRYSAGYGTLPDDTIKVHGKLYNDKDLLDGGSFKVDLAPFWFKFRGKDVDWNETTKELALHAITSSDLVPQVQCAFPEVFNGTIIGGGLYINGQYVKYTWIDTSGFETGTLIFTLNPDDPDYAPPAGEADVFPACRVGQNQTLSKGGELLINNAAGELYAFPNTKSVIEININGEIKLITYNGVEDADKDVGMLTGLGDVDELNPSVVENLIVKADDIVTLSKTLKITSTGACSEASKKLEYYRWVGKPMMVPIVYNTAEPDKDKLLAGGNFHWVSDAGGNDDATGHNVLVSEKDSNLGDAPGRTVGPLGSCKHCHKDMAIERDDEHGCERCHLNPHPDSDPEPGDEYCFLRGHRDGEGRGVTGIKDKRDQDENVPGDWQYSKDSDDHNEYRGAVGVGADNEGLDGYPYTITGYCTGCHGEFRSAQKDVDGDWIRHPSDWNLINSPPKDDLKKDDLKYAFGSDGIKGIGTYDPDVPVARLALNPLEPDSSLYIPDSGEVILDKDMVMCLSCHVAHGSQYPDMLRWDMKNMIVGTRPPEEEVGHGKGCFKCHTDKNNADYYAEGMDEERRCNYCHTMHDSQNGISVAVGGPYAYLLNAPSLTNPNPHKKTE